MRRRLHTLAAIIAIACGAGVIGLGVLFLASTRGECVLSFGRLDITGRGGLLCSRLFRDDDTPWMTPDMFFMEYAGPQVEWWSFQVGAGHSGWKPMREVWYTIVPIWAVAIAPLIVGLLCGWAWHRGVRRRRRGQCNKCGYPREGLPAGAPCPECGVELQDPSRSRAPV